MFRGGGTHWSTAFLFAPENGQFQHRHGLHDRGHAAPVPARHVGAERAAAGGERGPDHPDGLSPTEGTALPDRQFLCRRRAADSSGEGGEEGCSEIESSRRRRRHR